MIKVQKEKTERKGKEVIEIVHKGVDVYNISTARCCYGPYTPIY